MNFACLHFSFGQPQPCTIDDEKIPMYDIYTPMGSPVETHVTCEFSSVASRAFSDSIYESCYPNIKKIIVFDGVSTTERFNCHGYAWLYVEKGIDRWICYFRAGDEDIYMTDGSYIEVAQETFPGKVSWADGGHSAITTEQQGWFISKWGPGILCKHRWDDTPYGTPNLKYYVKNPCTYETEPFNFVNQTVNTNQTITDCIIYSQDVSVTNNAKLILDATLGTNIDGNFEIQLGSELGWCSKKYA